MCFTLNQHGGHSPSSPLFPGPVPQNISLEPRKHDRHPSKCFVQLRYTLAGQGEGADRLGLTRSSSHPLRPVLRLNQRFNSSS